MVIIPATADGRGPHPVLPPKRQPRLPCTIGWIPSCTWRRARTEIEVLLGARVFLDLRVRVEKDWQRRPGLIERLGM